MAATKNCRPASAQLPLSDEGWLGGWVDGRDRRRLMHSQMKFIWKCRRVTRRRRRGPRRFAPENGKEEQHIFTSCWGAFIASVELLKNFK